MKKILLVCENDHYPKGAFEFIKWMQRHEPVFVKGIFFTAVSTTDLVAAEYPVSVYNELQESRKEAAALNIAQFTEQCNNNHIPYVAVENDDSSWNKEFWQKETRYADLLLVSTELLSSCTSADVPDMYMEALLHWADCPAMLIPESVHPPEYVLAAYDGSPASIHAITQFCKTLPQYKALPAKFVYIKQEEEDHIPNLELLTEYVKAHFKNVEVLKLHCTPGMFFVTWVANHRNALLITGAFGRSALSNLFKKSFAAALIQKKTSSVFIAR